MAARWLLTELVPQLPALVRHAGALLPPQREPRVGHELLCDERQHPGAVGVSHPQHLPHLKHTAKPRGGAGQLLSADFDRRPLRVDVLLLSRWQKHSHWLLGITFSQLILYMNEKPLILEHKKAEEEAATLLPPSFNKCLAQSVSASGSTK